MKKIIIFLILGALIGGPLYIYNSKSFEQDAPLIDIKHSNYWNLKDNLNISISDESGLRYYKVTVINNKQAYILNKSEKVSNNSIVNIDFKIPKQYPISGNSLKIIVEAVDNSKWNFFAGNEIKKEFDFIIDNKLPEADILNNSYAIAKGGSAIAIVKAKDENLKNAYIEVNNHKKFKLAKFFKDDYYISLLAWPYEDKNFNAYLVVEDKAGNKIKRKIPFYYRKVKYKTSKINISDKFIERVDRRVLETMNIEIPNNNKDIFLVVNNKVRKINEKSIYDASNIVLEDKVDEFKILPFKAMRGAAKQADYGDIRQYFYKNQKIDEKIHKGLDLASYRHSKIYNSNKGSVIYKKYTGIYGNTLLIYHGLGLVSGYSHTSNIRVNMDDIVDRNQVVAITGNTGAVFGDHLHLGIFIQGIAVNPIEWMDRYWIKVNIENVINDSKRLLNK
jgi:murein DD-endopeptidase MepM/ murein hydrolase activator NlpD